VLKFIVALHRRTGLWKKDGNTVKRRNVYSGLPFLLTVSFSSANILKNKIKYKLLLYHSVVIHILAGEALS
jgi:hypothetical protein